jgi:hypothetical protein
MVYYAMVTQTDMALAPEQSADVLLKQAISAISKSIPNINDHIASIDKSHAAAMCKYYRKLKEYNKILEELQGMVKSIEVELSKRIIPEQLETLELDNIKSGGYTYSVGVRTFASIPVECRQEANKWLRDNGLGALISETVNAKTLSSAITAFIEEKGLKPPEGLIKVHQEKYISVRKT